MSGKVVTLHHGLMGVINGIEHDDVIQYLGVKYASLSNRLADAQTMQYSGKDTINATTLGPTVVMPEGSVDMEMSFIQHRIDGAEHLPPMSELDGLNLNITLPANTEVKNLPVLVYIHGGGFTFGSSSYPHYDQTKFVQLSKIMGQPIIAINLNYRLGLLGFLSSSELSEAGYKPNRGLRDQRIALRWIKQYISGFGGDPDRITVIGQSAGAASVTFHLHTEEALFNQAILLGGSFLMMKPATSEKSEALYAAIISKFGLKELSSSHRIKTLLELQIEKLLPGAISEMTMLGPVVDGDLIPSIATFTDLADDDELPLPGKKWCQALFSIESQFDGSIFGQVNLNARKGGINASFRESLLESLGYQACQVLLKAYNIGYDTSDADTLTAIIQFVTDIAFYAPSVKLSSLWPQNSWLGHFNELNPWDGPYKGRANHLLDTAYLWGNYNPTFDRNQWGCARAFAEDVISFTCNRLYTPPFTSPEKLITAYGPSDVGRNRAVVPMDHEIAGRSRIIFQVADQAGGLDRLLTAAVNFLIHP